MSIADCEADSACKVIAGCTRKHTQTPNAKAKPRPASFGLSLRVARTTVAGHLAMASAKTVKIGTG
eukprot:4996280-Prymnesium_polylepis.1